MRIINRSVLILLLLSFLCWGKIISQECRKDTVYIVFDSSKFAEERNYFFNYKFRNSSLTKCQLVIKV